MIDLTKRPPRKLLKQYNSFIASDPPFRSWCRLKQSIYRHDQGWECGTDGVIDEESQEQRRLGNYLVEADARAGRNFLNKSIADAAAKRLRNRERGDKIEERRLWFNLLTSQTLCFNLFLPQAADPELATSIWSHVLGVQAQVRDVKVEHSPGRRHATAGTGDKSAFDAFVRYQLPNEEHGILAIETKYTDSFSAASPKGKAYVPIKDCDRTDIQRAQATLIGSGTMNNDGWARVGAMRTQQLWRTHALAESMRRVGECDHVTYIVLHASGDEECSQKLPEYAQCLSDVASAEHRFRVITLEDFISAVRSVVSDTHRDWIENFHSRYLDWQPVQRLL